MANWGAKIWAYLQPRQHALLVATLILVADDASKEWALYALNSGQLPLWLVEGQIGFGFGWNRGMSFSLLDGFAYAPHLLGLVAVAAIAWFTHWLAAEGNPNPWPSLHQSGLAAIIGGAMGNLVDRLQHGAVVDFLVLNPWGLFPYTFNIADAAITFGVALLLLDMRPKPR
jgi:lipoprotein signal peptidase